MARMRLGGGPLRWVFALVIVIGSLWAYFGNSEYNSITEEKQYVSLTADQEIALGLQAAPQMAQQYGGLHPDQEAQQLVDRVGQQLVQNTAAAETPYQFEFHLLAG